jgi:UPF0716 protein FxsA
MDAVLFVVLSSFAGALIIRLLGTVTLTSLQKDLTGGQLPANQLLHRALVLIGGFFLFVPGILSDIFGILLILPGTRHLLAYYVKQSVKRGLFKGRVFMGGFGKTGGFSRPGPQTHPQWEPAHRERDAEVVDIEPLEITHKNLPPGGSNGSKT